VADQPEVVDEWLRYNETPWGRLRLDLIRWHLDRWLPAAPTRVLDVGCGTGETAIWMAGRGSQVIAMDRSEAMLAVARNRAGSAAVHVEWLIGDVPDALPSALFDLVVCHNVLGYLQDPESACVQMTSLLAAGGYLSVVVTNAVALPLQIASRDGDLRRALRAAKGETIKTSEVCKDQLVTHTPREVRRWLETARLHVIRQGAIRTVNDYISNTLKTDEHYPDLLALEQELSEQAPYNDIGTLVHILARKAT
jgi:S-adenosylmethionine-dependent methyltransferase